MKRTSVVAAVIGLDADHVGGRLSRRVQRGVITIANDNCPGQTVISGEVAALLRAMEMAKARGAKRVARLGISIASHSPLMARASTSLRDIMSRLPLRRPADPVVANVTATAMLTVDDVRQVGTSCRAARELDAVGGGDGQQRRDHLCRGRTRSGALRAHPPHQPGRHHAQPDRSRSAGRCGQPILALNDRSRDTRERGEIVKRVVVTGLGAAAARHQCPRAMGRIARSGVRRVQHFDTENLAVKIAAEVPDHPKAFMDPKSVRRMDRFAHFAIAGTGRPSRTPTWRSPTRTATVSPWS